MPYREIDDGRDYSRSVEHSSHSSNQYEKKSAFVGKNSPIAKKPEPVIEDVIPVEEVDDDDDFDSLSNIGIPETSYNQATKMKKTSPSSRSQHSQKTLRPLKHSSTQVSKISQRFYIVIVLYREKDGDVL